MQGFARIISILVPAVFCAGCSTAPARFPIGLYDVPPDSFARVAAAGFNTIVGPASQPTLDAARSNGLKIIGSVSVTDKEGIKAVRRHPALWGWYLFDEPDMHQVSPGIVAHLHARMHGFSSKPTLVVLMSGGAVEKYRTTADMVGVDWYPVPWAPVATIAREMRLARLAMAGRPFYAIMQGFDWNSFPELVRTEAPLRPPTPEEIRCMAFMALSQGAAGLLFYTYDNGRWKLEDHPQLWNAVAELARELNRTAPIFANRILWWPSETEYHGRPAEMYNEIMEGRIILTLYHVNRAAGPTAAGYYLVAINSSGSMTDFSFRLPFEGSVQLDSSCADFRIEEGSVRKTFAPFEVCIFGPINAPLSQ